MLRFIFIFYFQTVEEWQLRTFSSYTATLQPWNEQHKLRHLSRESDPKLVSFRNFAPRARLSLVRIIVFSLMSFSSDVPKHEDPPLKDERSKRLSSMLSGDDRSGCGQENCCSPCSSGWKAAEIPWTKKQQISALIRPLSSTLDTIFALVAPPPNLKNEEILVFLWQIKRRFCYNYLR